MSRDPYPSFGEVGNVARLPWYRRTAVLVTIGVLVFVAASVIADWPTPQSRSDQINTAKTTALSVSQDLKGCVFAVGEATDVYQQFANGSATPAERSQAPSVLLDDQNQCNFTNSSINALSQTPTSLSTQGKQLQHLVTDATLWASSSALSVILAIDDIAKSQGAPTEAQRNALASAYSQLETDRESVATDLNLLDQELGLTPPALLADPGLPRLSGMISAARG